MWVITTLIRDKVVYLSNDGINFTTDIDDALQHRTKSSLVTIIKNTWPSKRYYGITNISVLHV